MEKSAIIWNDFDTLRYAIVEGDWSAFQHTYIGLETTPSDLEQQLVDAMMNTDGEYIIQFYTIAEFQQAVVEGANVVECGFIP